MHTKSAVWRRSTLWHVSTIPRIPPGTRGRAAFRASSSRSKPWGEEKTFWTSGGRLIARLLKASAISPALAAIFLRSMRRRCGRSDFVGIGTKTGLPATTEAGRALAGAFSETIGEAGPAFLAAAKAGYIDRATLKRITVMRPSALSHESAEAAALRDLLLGRFVRGSAHTARRDSLRLILRETARKTERRLDQERLRWRWMEGVPEIDEPLRLTPRRRAALPGRGYCANCLLNFSCARP